LTVIATSTLNLTLGANISIYNSIFNGFGGTRTINIIGAGGTRTLTVTNQLELEGRPTLVASSAVIAYGTGATLNFNRGNNTTITSSSPEYPTVNAPTNITLTAAFSVTLDVNQTVTGVIALNGGTFIIAASRTLTLSGTLRLNGGAFTINGTGVLLANGIIRRLTTTGAVTISGTLTYGGSSQLQYNGTLTVGNEFTAASVVNLVLDSAAATITLNGIKTITNLNWGGNPSFNTINRAGFIPFTVTGSTTGTGTII
jgi:hypothetical protein